MLYFQLCTHLPPNGIRRRCLPRRANLLQRFLAPAAAERDTYEHVATILPNVTRIEAGRRVLMEPGRGTLRALASQLQSSSELRRRGCSGAIKNCCFSCEEDGTADAIVAESEALADMLSVLSGVTPTQHDDVVRENLADSVLCLAKVPSARKKLWEANAPELLKKGYELEEHPGVCEAMEAAAQFFLQDGFQNGGEGEREGEGAGEGEGEDGAEPPGRMVHIEEID